MVSVSVSGMDKQLFMNFSQTPTNIEDGDIDLPHKDRKDKETDRLIEGADFQDVLTVRAALDKSYSD